MSYDVDDTIAAIGTAPGGATRGMIRVSGPATLEIAAKCFAANDGAPQRPKRSATVRSGSLEVTLDGERSHRVPCELFLWPTDRSYTRQPVAEFHTLGSPPVLQAALAAICRAGARLAEPGEFTLRAFLAGRLDLTQAEAVLGVIDANEADQLSTALGQLAGGLARPLHHLREELLHLLAEVEAGLDFVEVDIRFIASEELASRLTHAADEIDAVAGQMSSRLVAATTCQIVLTGPPNAGKSSLFNALTARFGISDHRTASAIVSDERGTTRDYLLADIDVGGIRCELIDTAGLDDDPLGEIATAAQSLAQGRRRQAVIRAYCVDAASPADCEVPPAELVIVTKFDIAPHHHDPLIGIWNDPPTVVTSSVTGVGIDVLQQVLARLLQTNTAATSTGCVAATADRCHDSLRLAAATIRRATGLARARSGDELIALELRAALEEIGKVVGAIYTDDLLDRIFKTFCIGK